MTIQPPEVIAIIQYLKAYGVMATAAFFNRHRDTIRRICKKYGIIPCKGKRLKELSQEELNERWKEQDKCQHGSFVTRCSKCGRILGSDATV